MGEGGFSENTAGAFTNSFLDEKVPFYFMCVREGSFSVVLCGVYLSCTVTAGSMMLVSHLLHCKTKYLSVYLVFYLVQRV